MSYKLFLNIDDTMRLSCNSMSPIRLATVDYCSTLTSFSPNGCEAEFQLRNLKYRTLKTNHSHCSFMLLASRRQGDI